MVGRVKVPRARKLTDREGSLAQRLLQATSHKIYGGISASSDIPPLLDTLPYPEELRDLKVDLEDQLFFRA